MQNQKPMVFSWIVFAFWAALTVTAHAAPLKVDATKSSVSAVFKQMGVPIETKFTKFSAQVDYDAAKPQNSKAIVDIDITSFDLGDPDYNQEVQKKNGLMGLNFQKRISLQEKSLLRGRANWRFPVSSPLKEKLPT